MNLLSHVNIRNASTVIGGVNDSTKCASQWVDCDGFDSICFLITLSSGVSSKAYCEIQGSSVTGTTASALRYASTISVSGATAGASTNHLAMMDLAKVDKRYNRCVSLGNSTERVGFIALLYNGRVPGSTSLQGHDSILASTILFPTTA